MCEMVKRGIPAAVICSEPFLHLGRAQARVFGVPNLPFIVIPHPLGGLSLEQIEGRAHHAVPQIVEMIKASRS